MSEGILSWVFLGVESPGEQAKTGFPRPPESSKMTLDKSLKVRAGAIKSRNVMTRAERIKRLQDLNRWSEDSIVLGMAKVRVPKVSLKKKKKVKKEEETDDKKKKKK